MDSIAATEPRGTALWSATVSGAYASAATALFFLVVDSVGGQPLHTASMLGSVVLLGEDPGVAAAFRLDLVALYSLIHLAAFVLFGAAVTSLYRRFERMRPPAVLTTLLTIALTGGVALLDVLFFPGLVLAIGPLSLLGGNLAAAAAMAWVLTSGLAPHTD